jgi:arsenate reductase
MKKKNIMFLCTGNSCRSQIAEGWARKLWGERYEFFSAGTHKHGMNARAIKVMKDAGVDISSHFSKTIEELPAVTFDYVITVCDNAKETCPYFPAGKIVHIGFEDPPRLTKDLKDEDEILKAYCRVRDEIREAMRMLPDLLGDP